MAQPRVLILRAPGTNCDQETAFAFQQAGASTDVVHIQRLLEDRSRARDYQVLCLPGGFSYGDDVAAGRIVASQIRHHLLEMFHTFRADDKLMLGICNGFQILVKSGLLLPEQESDPAPPATLTWNNSGRFEDRWVHLAVDGHRCVFLQGIESMYLPIAHAEGKFVTRDAEALQQLGQNGQLALRYCCATNGEVSDVPLEFPFNPNGSQANVAGVCDASGRVFGLMPHPERHIHVTQHPQWTRKPRAAGSTTAGDGLKIFENAVNYFR